MAELRRLLIDPKMISVVDAFDSDILLNPNEAHYLRRVLRLKKNESFAIVDGVGHLWEALLISGNTFKLKTDFYSPLEEQPLPTPLICLGVVVPRHGFDEVLRMCCEIGVDLLQPLRAERSSFYIDLKVTS